MTFEDHFSGHARVYALFRPEYPAAWYATLAALAPGRALAWDCGTGNGQAAAGLAAHFRRVYATDASAEQIALARPAPGVTYAVAPAEQCALPDGAVDLVTVAQAVHWFDHARFYAEVQRVLRPGSVLAVWVYHLIEVDPAVDALIVRYHNEVVGPYWPARARLAHTHYSDLPFPFDELPAPAPAIELDWTLDELLGHLGSWSAAQRYRAARGAEPLDAIRDELAAAWGAARVRRLRWPLYARVGRRRAG
jgi:SAM-dependent methyltransferase